MTQYARPISDVSTQWLPDPGWQEIDEEIANDADFIIGTGSTKTVEVLLSEVDDPGVSHSHLWKIRVVADAGGGGGERMSLYLYEGAALLDTLIANAIISRNGFYELSDLLSAETADSIADYSDLRFRFVTGNGNNPDETISISWAVLEVPSLPWPVSNNMQAEWDLHQLADNSLSASWDIFSLVSNSLEVTYSMIMHIGNALNVVWNIVKPISKILKARWNLGRVIVRRIYSMFPGIWFD